MLPSSQDNSSHVVKDWVESVEHTMQHNSYTGNEREPRHSRVPSYLNPGSLESNKQAYITICITT